MSSSFTHKDPERTLSGNNTYGGLTTVNAGTLTLSGNNSGMAGGVSLAGGTLNINNNNALGSGTMACGAGPTTIGNTSGSPVTVTNALMIGTANPATTIFAGPNDLILAGPMTQPDTVRGWTWTVNGGERLTISGLISGAQTLTMNGTGTLVLSNTNSTYGTTGANLSLVVSAGTVEVAQINNDATNGPLGVAAVGLGGSGTVGTLRYTGSGTTTNSHRIGCSNTGGGIIEIVNANATLSLSGTMTYPNYTGGTLTKIGPGTLQLSYAYATYSGKLTVQNGILNVAGVNNDSAQGPLGQNSLSVTLGGSGTTGTLEYTSSTLASSKKFTMAAGGAGIFQVDTAGTTLTLSGLIDGSGNLIKTGAGTLALAVGESYTGDTTINAGTLALTNTGALNGSTNLTVASNATFNVGSSFSLLGFQVLLGSGAVTNNVGTSSGAKIYAATDGTYGTLTFNNNLTLTNGVSCYFDLQPAASGPSDQIAVGGVLTPNNNDIHIKATALDALDYTLIAFGSLAGGNTNFNLIWDAAPPTSNNYSLVVDAVNHAVKLKYAVAGSTVRTWTGLDGADSQWQRPLNWNSAPPNAGDTVEFTGAPPRVNPYMESSYSLAGMTFDPGASAFTLTAAGGATLTNLPGGGVVNNSASLQTLNLPIALAGPLGFNTAAGDIAVGGAINGPSAVTKSGNGTLTLSGNNSGMGGGVALSAGTLNVNNNNALGSGALTIGGGTALDNTSGGSVTLANAMNWNGNFIFAGTTNLTQQAGAVALGTNSQVTVANNTLSVGGAIGDSGLNRTLTKAGNGTLVLAGNNTYGGVTTVNAGTLHISHNNALGAGAGNTTVAGGATLEIGGGLTVNEAITLGTAATLKVAASGSSTLGATITVATTPGSTIYADTGSSLTLNGSTSIGPGNGCVTFDGPGNITINTATATTFGPMTKNGAGVLTLNGVYGTTGSKTVNQGTLLLGVNNVLGTGNGGLLTMAGGTLDLGGHADTVFGVILTNASSIVNGALTSTDVINLYGGTISASLSGSVSMSQRSGLSVLSGDNSGFSGGLTIVGGILEIQSNKAMCPGGSGTMTVQAGGALQIRGGLTIPAEGGTFLFEGTGINNAGGIRNMADDNTYQGLITLSFNGRINADGASSLTIAPPTGVSIAAGVRVLTLGGTGNITLSGGMSGTTAALAVDGTGVVRLGGTSTYTGATTVTNGTLLVNGTLAATAITVGNPGVATLGGTGTVAGTVHVYAGSTLSPGDPSIDSGNGAGVGTLTISNTLTLASGSLCKFQLIDQTHGDLVAVSTNLSLTGVQFYLYQADGVTPFTTAGTYTLMTCSGMPTISGLTVQNLPAYVAYTFIASAGELQVSLVHTNTGTVYKMR